MADFSKNCKLCRDKAMAQRKLFGEHLCNINQVNCLYFNDIYGKNTEDLRLEYEVYHNGCYEGTTLAISEEKACNNMRYANYGLRPDDGGWEAICIDPESKQQMVKEIAESKINSKCKRTKKYKYYVFAELTSSYEGQWINKFVTIYSFSYTQALHPHYEYKNPDSFIFSRFCWVLLDKFETKAEAIAYLEQHEKEIEEKYTFRFNDDEAEGDEE